MGRILVAALIVMRPDRVAPRALVRRQLVDVLLLSSATLLGQHPLHPLVARAAAEGVTPRPVTPLPEGAPMPEALRIETAPNRAPAAPVLDVELAPAAPVTDVFIPTAREDAAAVPPIRKLKLIDQAVGKGDTPEWGDLVRISYTGYTRASPSAPLAFFDSCPEPTGFLVKHGNGRTIKGLDLGLHSMREGGRRRIVVPPELAYTVGGLGPLPTSPFRRRALNRQLETLGPDGVLVWDVSLLQIFEDEADQGYYRDTALTEQELNKGFGELPEATDALRAPAVPANLS